ncbi:hypothetical protein [Halochromatium glycolicum]|uniref:Uncharacterized protein n=1 Tax=Halochromatium glycolicum TaxID=85075 RepID=A0AAJ0XCC5_9GAMM|nr:hypothetical protein [Halochromatium glycolicum]MBK1707283.1 hypothetical protein [Halochromatium glycolicum]
MIKATEFSKLNWHDAELLDIKIDRRNPGERDQVIINVRWPTDEQSELVFSDCYELEAKMNFGVIAPESILDASLIDDSQGLDEVRMKWAHTGVDLGDLKCFEIRTNSTNSLLRIYALSYSF